MSVEVEFHGAVAKVQTLADLGIRLVIDMDEGAIQQAAELMAIRQSGMTVRVKVTAVEHKE